MKLYVENEIPVPLEISLRLQNAPVVELGGEVDPIKIIYQTNQSLHILEKKRVHIPNMYLDANVDVLLQQLELCNNWVLVINLLSA